MCPSCVLLRRSTLLAAGPFDESLKRAEDWDLWVRVAERVRIEPLPEGLADRPLHEPPPAEHRAAVRVGAGAGARPTARSAQPRLSRAPGGRGSPVARPVPPPAPLPHGRRALPARGRGYASARRCGELRLGVPRRRARRTAPPPRRPA